MRQAPTEEQVLVILRSIEHPSRSTETDRAIALVGANLVDYSLQLVILSHFVEMGQTEIEDLFGAGGPLGSLSAKIRIAHALAIVHDDDRDVLSIIRSVRNAFAHTTLHVSFRTPAVVSACRKFQMPQKMAAKAKFIATVAYFSGVLSGHARARLAIDARPKKAVVIREP
jgi:hypothetical protein